MDINDLTIESSHETPSFQTITQEQIQQFADATGDHQWIHVDEAKCKELSPHKSTIAHGFLTLSLMPKMFEQCVEVNQSTTTMINYGIDYGDIIM